MAILRSTLVNGDLTVTGSLNVQGDLTYVGVENLRVKDHQIELNANDKGSASLAGADQAGIVIRGAQNTQKNPDSKEASILYNHAEDTLVINKTIEGTVSNATTAASANKVAYPLTVNVTNESGSTTTVEFDGSAEKTVNVNLKGLQDQINSLTGGTSSVATQISNAISELDVTDAAVTGQYVSSVSETDGKISVTRAALPDYTNVYDAKGAADDALAEAKSYANGLNTNMDGRVQTLESASHTHSNKDELDSIAVGDKAKWDGHVDNADIHVTAEQKTAWSAKQDALANANVLSAITNIQVRNWDDAASKAHEHANKTVLDGITTEKVAAWDGAVGARVNSIGGKSGNLTLKGGSATLGDVNLSISDTGEISAAIVPNSFDVKGAADAAKNAAIADAATKYQTKGNYEIAGAAATAKSEVIGTIGDAADKDTIYGAKKYADTVVNNLSGSVAATDAAQDTKITNIQNSITGIQNDYVKKVGDTMTGDLTMPSNGTNGIVFGNMKIVWKDNAIEFIPTTA